MARGVSLHIGVKNYSKFNGIDPLKSPWNVARAMYRFAYNLGYRPLDGKIPSDGSDPTNVMIEEDASLGAVTKAIKDIAAALRDGDAFLLTFAGHGTQVSDPRLREPDSKNEVSILADEYLIDDMLQALLAKFERGVRIFFVADACHSGTSIGPPPAFLRASSEQFPPEPEPGAIMTILDSVSLEIWLARREKYLAMVAAEGQEAELKAFAVQFAACKDNQLTRDGSENSYSRFTQKFLDRWNQGFSEGCREFARAVDLQAPRITKSTPQCTPVSSTEISTQELEEFLAKTPFKL